MKLGLSIGYIQSASQIPVKLVASGPEELGYDSVWSRMRMAPMPRTPWRIWRRDENDTPRHRVMQLALAHLPMRPCVPVRSTHSPAAAASSLV